MTIRVERVHARQILDSRGNPTVEVEVELGDGTTGRAAVPSGASTGTHEAVELRDGGEAWSGKGVGRAVANVNGEIASALREAQPADMSALDRLLIDLDATPNKGRLGANAILGTSLATAHALARQAGQPLWQWLGNTYSGLETAQLPVPMLNVINGGEHANNSLDVQEFMVVPHGFDAFSEALEAAVRVFHQLRADLDRRGYSTAVGDEGGFAPELPGGNTAALELLAGAIEAAGFEPGRQMSIALDVAATELLRDGRYHFAGDDLVLEAGELAERYADWVGRFPLVSIEDGMAEDDMDGWRTLTERLGSEVQLVGDDLFVTNPSRLRTGIEQGIANALLVKVNQIGTLTETLEAMSVAAAAGYRNVMSHRSGETEDATIADLAVGTGCGQIKTGAPSRSDRTAKYNQLLRIEEQLAAGGAYARPFDTLVEAR